MAKLNKTITPELILETLKTEYTVASTCKKLGISRQTYYRWLDEYGRLQGRDFHKETVKALKEGVQTVNDYCENELVKKIFKGDIQAIKFWLRHNHDNYKQSYIIQG